MRRCALLAAAACAALAAATPALALQPGVTPQQQAVEGSFLLSAPEPAERGAVCIIDDGVEQTPDTEHALLDRVALPGVRPTGDGGGTATQLASILVGRRNGWGVAGLSRGITILSVVPWNRRPGSEQTAANLSADAVAACTASEHPVRVIVIAPSGRARIDQSRLQLAVHAARTADISVVAATGEDPLGLFRWPSDVRGVIAVGADSGDACAFPSSRAAFLVPACGLALPTPQGGTRRIGSGSMVAASLMAGTLTALRAYAPHLSRQGAEDLLRISSDAATAGGPRRVSARRAFAAAGLTSLTAETLTPSTATLRRPPRVRVRSTRGKGRSIEVTFRMPSGTRLVWPVGEEVTASGRQATLRRSTFTRQVLVRLRTGAGVIGPGAWVRVPGLR